MDIIIVGGGKVGQAICKALSTEDNNIMLIEKNDLVLSRSIDDYDITGIVGSGVSYDTLVEAGVENVDIFIATADRDEVNLISCILAKRLGAKRTIARVREPEYSEKFNLVREGLGIDLLINPDLSAAKDIAKLIRYPSALSVESFLGNRVNLIEMEILPEHNLHGITIPDFRENFPGLIICAIVRNNELIIPSGVNHLEDNDRIFVTGFAKDIANFHRQLTPKKKRIRGIFIIGGSRIAHYLLRQIEHAHYNIKVIERDEKRCEELSYRFPDVVIIHGDGTDQNFLLSQGIEHYDVVISLTGVDEENLITSLFAEQFDHISAIAKMSRTAILNVVNLTKKQTVITPKEIVATDILRFVRAKEEAEGASVESLYRLWENRIEVAQFRINEQSPLIGKTIAEVNVPNGILIAFIMRKGKVIFPTGRDSIIPSDRVVLVTKYNSTRSIKDLY